MSTATVPPAASAICAGRAAKNETLRRGLRLRCSLRLLLPILLVWSAAGCGSGGLGDASGFTGGGFPIGATRMTGKVVQSQDPLRTLPNAAITVVSTFAGSSPVMLQTTSAADGTFTLDSIPTGSVNAALKVTIQPSDPSVRPQELDFLVTNGHKETLIAALSDVSFDITQAASVVVSPPTIDVHSGITVPISAQVLDKAGKPLSVTPSLLFDGDFGTVSNDGTFYGTANGTGKVTALWYNNLQSTPTTVTVDNSLPFRPLPPAPPVILNPQQ